MGCLKLTYKPVFEPRTHGSILSREAKVVQMFIRVDPLAEVMPEWSSYSYGFNNPIKFTDPTGMIPEESGGSPCPDCPEKYGATLPTVTVTASRTGGQFYDQTPERYGYNGSFSNYQKEFGFEGVSYENVSNYYEQVHRTDFNASVASADKAEADRIAVEKMGMFAEWYAMIGAVTAPAGGGGPINGVNYAGPGLRTFNYTSQYTGIRTSLINNSYFVNTRGPGYWTQPGHGKFPSTVNRWIIRDGKMNFNSTNNSWNFSLNGYKNNSYGKFSLGIRRDGGIFHSTFYGSK